MLNIADGLEPVGRRIIAQSTEKASDHIQSAVLGYVYKSRFCESVNNKELVTTKHANRLLIEPKLAIRLGNSPDKSCSFEEFFIHIESQFIDGMSWENRSLWHIDHIIPLATAKTEEEILRLNHYTNLRPLWALDNLKKGSKILC
jgi:hypothetical protein